MRTTIDLDDELLRTAKSLAAARQQSLSRVICDLAWKGLQPAPAEDREESGFPTFGPLPGSSTVTPSHVEELLHDTEDQS